MSVYKADDASLFRLALRSIFDQQLIGSAELRIYLYVDGPVPDALDRVIQEYEPHIYRLLWGHSNVGLARALNQLISIRQDEELYFRMDADDISLPERFARQIGYMLEHPDVDILGTAIIEVDDRRAVRRIIRYASSPAHARRLIARRVPVAHPTICLRPRVFDLIDQYPVGHTAEDAAMWFKCMKAGLTFSNLSEPLYEFRVGGMHGRRSGFMKSWSEFRTYAAGIWSLDGITWRYMFPMARLLSRLMPLRFQEWLYSSRLR